jgi:hypothetical protein
MPGNTFGGFPKNPFNPQNQTSLPNWMQRNLQGGWLVQQRAQELRQRLAPATSAKSPLQPQHLQDLTRHLASIQRQQVMLTADSVRRLQATLRSAREAVLRFGSGGDRQLALSLSRWESFLEEASTPRPPRSRA